MGPNESQLRLVDDAIPGALTAKAIAWNEAKATLDELRSQVDTARRRARATWQGDDAEAALVSFDEKARTIEEMQERMDSAQQGMRIAADALSGARSALASLEAVPDQPTTPTHPGTDASDDQLTAHSAAMSDHGMAVRARNAAMARREAQAGQALDSLDSQLAVARNLLTRAAPAPEDFDKHTGRAGAGSPMTAGGGGTMAAAPVVGGATTAAALTRRPGAGGGSAAGRQSVLRPTASAGLSGNDSSTEGSAPSEAPTLAQAGGSGMGGIGGAAGAAGVIGAGKSIVNKLTGNQARTASPAAGTGRTAGMQKGSTLGSNANPAARAQQAGTAGQRPASPLGGRQAGAPASARPASGAPGGARTAGAPSSARPASGAPGGARTAGAPSSARPAAGGSRTAGSAAGRSATSPGARAGATPAAGRGAAGAGAGKPAATAAGARGAGGSAGARGAGAPAAARGATGTGPKGAAAGARGSARDRRQDDDERRDHMAFDDDQWIDGDETAPGVLS